MIYRWFPKLRKFHSTSTEDGKLTGAYSDKANLVWVSFGTEANDYVLISTNGRALIINSALIPEKQTRSTLGVQVMTQKKGQTVREATFASIINKESQARYRTRKLPAAGALLKDTDTNDNIDRE